MLDVDRAGPAAARIFAGQGFAVRMAPSPWRLPPGSALEAAAAAAGLRTLVLNTGPQQPEAIALYLSGGYTPVPPFGHYADTRGALFYGRALG